jgi:hypothetical protein
LELRNLVGRRVQRDAKFEDRSHVVHTTSQGCCVKAIPCISHAPTYKEAGESSEGFSRDFLGEVRYFPMGNGRLERSGLSLDSPTYFRRQSCQPVSVGSRLDNSGAFRGHKLRERHQGRSVFSNRNRSGW